MIAKKCRLMIRKRLLSVSKLLKSQRMPIRLRNLQQWSRLLQKQPKRHISKEFS